MSEPVGISQVEPTTEDVVTSTQSEDAVDPSLHSGDYGHKTAKLKASQDDIGVLAIYVTANLEPTGPLPCEGPGMLEEQQDSLIRLKEYLTLELTQEHAFFCRADGMNVNHRCESVGDAEQTAGSVEGMEVHAGKSDSATIAKLKSPPSPPCTDSNRTMTHPATDLPNFAEVMTHPESALARTSHPQRREKVQGSSFQNPIVIDGPSDEQERRSCTDSTSRKRRAASDAEESSSDQPPTINGDRLRLEELAITRVERALSGVRSQWEHAVQAQVFTPKLCATKFKNMLDAIDSGGEGVRSITLSSTSQLRAALKNVQRQASPELPNIGDEVLSLVRSWLCELQIELLEVMSVKRYGCSSVKDLDQVAPKRHRR
ncbi:hypothetical protein EK21DRAFT_95642 [Setomelanomma holmii]|uniref:Uncharacterized protein n=1 Tax=Setomelanomma holmii TaxID=210430 RepID=A0A9P4GV30_9PLEO|nr:hypothetical protein EK21DRAFT_95642 [Setomelanomma holmii]